MPAPACSNTLPKRRNPDGNKTAQEGTNTRCVRNRKDRLPHTAPFPQGRGLHHLQSPYFTTSYRGQVASNRTSANDMYTRREVYISDPAPYRQTLTCTAKDVFANDQAPAPDNNATVRNQGHTVSSFSCPVPNRTNTRRRFRPASEPYRVRPLSSPGPLCDRASAHSPFVHGTAGKVPLGL